MKRNLNRALCGALLLAAALQPACKKKEEPPPAPPAAQKPAPAPTPAPAPAPGTPGAPGVPGAPGAVQKPVSSATRAAANGFDFRNRRDPFKPFVSEPAPAKPQGPGTAVAPSGDRLPIQSYEVGRFRVTGIIAGIRQNRALLVDPTGKPYVVQEGMAIGPSGGRITKITTNSVEVVERYRDDAGRIKTRKVVLTLAKKR